MEARGKAGQRRKRTEEEEKEEEKRIREKTEEKIRSIIINALMNNEGIQNETATQLIDKIGLHKMAPKESKPSWFEAAANIAAGLMPYRKDSDLKLFSENGFDLYEQATWRLMRSKEILKEQYTRAQVKVQQRNAIELDEYGKSAEEESEELENYVKQMTQEAIANALSLALTTIKIIRRTRTERKTERVDEGRFDKPRMSGKSDHMEEDALDVIRTGLSMALVLDKAKTPKTKADWTSICEAMIIDSPLPSVERENEKETMIHVAGEIVRLSEPTEKEPGESIMMQPEKTEECSVCGSWKTTKERKQAVMKIDDRGKDMHYVRRKIEDAAHENITPEDREEDNVCPISANDMREDKWEMCNNIERGPWGCCMEDRRYERIIKAKEIMEQQNKGKSEKEQRSRNIKIKETVRKNAPRPLRKRKTEMVEMPSRITIGLKQGQRATEKTLDPIIIKKKGRTFTYRPTIVALEREYLGARDASKPKLNDARASDSSRPNDESMTRQEGKVLEKWANSYMVLYRNEGNRREIDNEEMMEEDNPWKTRGWSAWADDIAEADELEETLDKHSVVMIGYQRGTEERGHKLEMRKREETGKRRDGTKHSTKLLSVQAKSRGINSGEAKAMIEVIETSQMLEKAKEDVTTVRDMASAYLKNTTDQLREMVNEEEETRKREEEETDATLLYSDEATDVVKEALMYTKDAMAPIPMYWEKRKNEQGKNNSEWREIRKIWLKKSGGEEDEEISWRKMSEYAEKNENLSGISLKIKTQSLPDQGTPHAIKIARAEKVRDGRNAVSEVSDQLTKEIESIKRYQKELLRILAQSHQRKRRRIHRRKNVEEGVRPDRRQEKRSRNSIQERQKEKTRRNERGRRLRGKRDGKNEANRPVTMAIHRRVNRSKKHENKSRNRGRKDVRRQGV